MQRIHPYGRKGRGTNEPLDESENREWKSGIKFNIQETKIMASGPISIAIRWGNNENSERLYFGGIHNADCDFSHEV